MGSCPLRGPCVAAPRFYAMLELRPFIAGITSTQSTPRGGTRSLIPYPCSPVATRPVPTFTRARRTSWVPRDRLTLNGCRNAAKGSVSLAEPRSQRGSRVGTAAWRAPPAGQRQLDQLTHPIGPPPPVNAGDIPQVSLGAATSARRLEIANRNPAGGAYRGAPSCRTVPISRNAQRRHCA